MSDLWGDIKNTPVYDPSSYNSGRVPSNELGKDDFLMLLITQMKYQDPMEPMDNQQSMAQLAQFSALEQMQNVAKASNQQQAFSLIGKVIIGESYAEASGEYEQIFGRVDAVRIKNGDIYLVVGEKEMEISGLKDVIDNPEDNIQLSNVNSNIAALQSLSLIGKTIQGVLRDEEGNPTKYIEGNVDQVKIVNGVPVLVVGANEIRPELVVSVGGDGFVLGKNITIEEEIDGETTTTKGTISGIEFGAEKINLIVDGDKKATIENIGELTKMLSYIGKQVTASGTTGKPESLTVKDGQLYLIVDGTKVKYDEISKIV